MTMRCALCTGEVDYVKDADDGFTGWYHIYQHDEEECDRATLGLPDLRRPADIEEWLEA